MKKYLLGSAAALALVIGGTAYASEVFSVWGHGTGYWDARDDARAAGEQLCVNAGYNGAHFEEVQTYQSGGGWITYGLATCY